MVHQWWRLFRLRRHPDRDLDFDPAARGCPPSARLVDGLVAAALAPPRLSDPAAAARAVAQRLAASPPAQAGTPAPARSRWTPALWASLCLLVTAVAVAGLKRRRCA